MEKSGNQASAQLRRSQKISEAQQASCIICLCCYLRSAQIVWQSAPRGVFSELCFHLAMSHSGAIRLLRVNKWTVRHSGQNDDILSMTFWDESVDDVTRDWSWAAGCVHWWAAAQVRSVSGRTFMQRSARNHADQKSQGRKVTKGAWHWKAYLNCAKQSSSDRNVQSFMATTKSILFSQSMFIYCLSSISSYWFYCPYMSLYLAVFHFAICWGSDLWWSGFVSASPTAQDAWPQTASWNGFWFQKVQPKMRTEISNLMWSKSI